MADDTSQILAAINALRGELSSLRGEVALLRSEVRGVRNITCGDKKTLALSRASRIYQKRQETLRALWIAGRIEGKEVPGRGKSGRELRLSIASLDRLFGIMT